MADGRRPVDCRAKWSTGTFRQRAVRRTAPPAVVDITPYWRPAGWAAGVIAVDALAWGARRSSCWPSGTLAAVAATARRALLFRLAVGLAHPRTPPSDLVTMLSTAERMPRTWTDPRVGPCHGS